MAFSVYYLIFIRVVISACRISIKLTFIVLHFNLIIFVMRTFCVY